MNWTVIYVDGLKLAVTRRRYSNRTFTWLLYYAGADLRWLSYGDPWPSVIIPKAQLAEAARDIKRGLQLIGQKGGAL